jgi:hypothetical protein
MDLSACVSRQAFALDLPFDIISTDQEIERTHAFHVGEGDLEAFRDETESHLHLEIETGKIAIKCGYLSSHHPKSERKSRKFRGDSNVGRRDEWAARKSQPIPKSNAKQSF